MPELREIKTESLTKAVYHLKTASEYFADVVLSSEVRQKIKAKLWHERAKWILTDIYSSITEASRKRFQKEITHGDVLFFDSISQRLIELTPEQRELVETVIESMLKGEKIIVEKT